MKIHLIAVGTHMPAWINIGYQEYAKRLPPECSLRLIEIEAGKRTKNCDITKLIEQESQQMLAAIPKNNHVIALDVQGRAWDTPQLAQQLQSWLHSGQDISLLIGGPDGLSSKCRQTAHARWSLSPLTLPHPLVRVMLAEQLYRAWSILQNHPYHR